MSDGIAGKQVVGIDLHLHRSVICRIDDHGNELGWVRIDNEPKALRAECRKAGRGAAVAIAALLRRSVATDLAAVGRRTSHNSGRAGSTPGVVVREDGDVKRSTAIGHLVEIGEVSSEQLRFRGTAIGWPVEELWVAGDLLGIADTVDAGSVVVVLNVPPDEAPWLAINHAGEWAGDQLGLRKRPLLWCYRPVAWPTWNHQHRRLARYWSAGDGLNDTVIDALRTRQLDRLHVVEPTASELARQLHAELPVSRRHLRTVIERYWDRDWRREHKGHDESPEDHLWRAAAAVSEMQDALDELETPASPTPSILPCPRTTTQPLAEPRTHRYQKDTAMPSARRPSSDPKINTTRFTLLAPSMTTVVVRSSWSCRQLKSADPHPSARALSRHIEPRDQPRP